MSAVRISMQSGAAISCRMDECFHTRESFGERFTPPTLSTVLFCIIAIRPSFVTSLVNWDSFFADGIRFEAVITNGISELQYAPLVSSQAILPVNLILSSASSYASTPHPLLLTFQSWLMNVSFPTTTVDTTFLPFSLRS